MSADLPLLFTNAFSTNWQPAVMIFGSFGGICWENKSMDGKIKIKSSMHFIEKVIRCKLKIQKKPVI
jgi:hypothetical protein